jgi:hypothetical protein
MKMGVFWVVALCRAIALMMEAASTSETSVNLYTAQQPRRPSSSLYKGFVVWKIAGQRRRSLHIPRLCHKEWEHEEALMMAILPTAISIMCGMMDIAFVCKGKLILFYCNPVAELHSFYWRVVHSYNLM